MQVFVMTQGDQELLTFYSEGRFPSCLYLFGQKFASKRFCLHNFMALKENDTVIATINAEECYTSKILFESVINAFNDHQQPDGDELPPQFCTDLIEDFLNELTLMDPEKSYLICIENAEKLRDMDNNIIPVFVRLQEFTGLNISCVLVSHLPLSKLGLPIEIEIDVPHYSKNDMIEELSSKYEVIHRKMLSSAKKRGTPDEELDRELRIINQLDETFYKSYLTALLNLFYKTCRDVTELRALANEWYPAYYTPVLKGEIPIADVTNLWRNFTKELKAASNTSYSRIETASYENTPSAALKPEETVKESSIQEFAQTLELPYYAKYLLIASFLASHNDAKFDKRLFMKHHGKEKKRQLTKESGKMNIHSGPKSFTIDRLLAIFYAILEEKVGLTCNLMSQISSLVDLNFLTFISGESSILEGSARLQSTIGLDLAANIGKVVGFNVKQFLTDFH